MKAVLMTQCLQNDFIKPLAHDEPMPNKLHIGHQESYRLVGESIERGPIGSFMHWAQQQASLHTIHIRDWHDPSCPSQAAHLQLFDQHCIQHSEGAQFIFDLPPEHKAAIVNSTTLNDFEETNLGEALAEFSSEAAKQEKIRIGLIGVWTEAKILFLAYELSTRYPHFDIAICSALTASSSRSQHFLALQQLERIVGVNVIDSIGEFCQFLGGKAYTPLSKSHHKQLNIMFDSELNLDDESEQLIRYLFRDCTRIQLKILDGGFSGNIVAFVTSFDVHGHEQTPHVIKIGPRQLMAKERTSFEQIENILGNNAPAIAEYADTEHRGAIKYRYASMGGDKSISLQGLFQNYLSAPEICRQSQQKLQCILNEIYVGQLGRLYRVNTNETCDLLQYYCFSSEWANSVKTKIEELVGVCPEKGKITITSGVVIDNLYDFYQNALEQLPSLKAEYPFSFVHGDLNGANVILDGKENVWIIDFFHTHRGHVVKDFAKFENDLLYIFTPIDSDDELQQAFQFTDFLLQQEDPFLLPSSPSNSLPVSLKDSAFARSYDAMQQIRNIAHSYLPSVTAHKKLQWLVPQLRYAVHTIGFDEPNDKQRIWALYTAARISEQLRQYDAK